MLSVGSFAKVRDTLENQFKTPFYIEDSGLSKDELSGLAEVYTSSSIPKATAKARTLELVLTRGRIGVDKEDIFQDKLDAIGIMSSQKWKWHREMIARHLSEQERFFVTSSKIGAGRADADYGHLTPDTMALVKLGLTGIVDRIVAERDAKETLTEAQRVFYEAAEITWRSVITFAKRLADAVRPYNADNADCLDAIAVGAPKTTYEAMQLIWLYFAVHELICGERVRTLGRLDVLLYPFYKADIESGRYTDAEIREMMRYFLFKMWSAKIPFDLPFTIGGETPDGKRDVTNEMSCLIVEIYDELNIHSPKIHVRVSDKTPKDFVMRVLECIRRGNSSFLFMNDKVAVEGLMRVGIDEADARNYVPVGCYENAAWGVEMPCTGNAAIAMPKAIEYTVTRGRDNATGAVMSVDTGEIVSFEDFVSAVKTHLRVMRDNTVSYINEVERHYSEVNPDLMTSGLCEYAVKSGVDALEGSAKYNNSSINYMGIATLVDSVAAVKRLVFDEGLVTVSELFDALKSNWEGYEEIREKALSLPEKYGNCDELCDSLMREFSDFVSSMTNNTKNSRGGVYKSGLYSIDCCFTYGKGIMATPDGRRATEQFSKNLCSVGGMDRKGITSLISSVAKIDHAAFANGTVLDYILHPSAVSGEDGLSAMYAIVKTYFDLGGLALHGNVFNSKILRAAKKDPKKYANLQVRVCGWNVFFVNLSEQEQDAFILQSERA